MLTPTMLTPAQIVQILRESFAEDILAAFVDDQHPRVHVKPERWLEIARFLKTDPRLKFDWLSNLSGMDYVADNQLAVVYDLWSFDLKHSFAVKVYCDRVTPSIPSVANLWKAADWHEREAYDMVGIVFVGHPDPRRILLPDDWAGFPLRKDYIFPREYRGIPGSVELDWQQKREKK